MRYSSPRHELDQNFFVCFFWHIVFETTIACTHERLARNPNCFAANSLLVSKKLTFPEKQSFSYSLHFELSKLMFRYVSGLSRSPFSKIGTTFAMSRKIGNYCVFIHLYNYTSILNASTINFLIMGEQHFNIWLLMPQ